MSYDNFIEMFDVKFHFSGVGNGQDHVVGDEQIVHATRTVGSRGKPDSLGKKRQTSSQPLCVEFVGVSCQASWEKVSDQIGSKRYQAVDCAALLSTFVGCTHRGINAPSIFGAGPTKDVMKDVREETLLPTRSVVMAHKLRRSVLCQKHDLQIVLLMLACRVSEDLLMCCGGQSVLLDLRMGHVSRG